MQVTQKTQEINHSQEINNPVKIHTEPDKNPLKDIFTTLIYAYAAANKWMRQNKVTEEEKEKIDKAVLMLSPSFPPKDKDKEKPSWNESVLREEIKRRIKAGNTPFFFHLSYVYASFLRRLKRNAVQKVHLEIDSVLIHARERASLLYNAGISCLGVKQNVSVEYTKVSARVSLFLEVIERVYSLFVSHPPSSGSDPFFLYLFDEKVFNYVREAEKSFKSFSFSGPTSFSLQSTLADWKKQEELTLKEIDFIYAELIKENKWQIKNTLFLSPSFFQTKYQERQAQKTVVDICKQVQSSVLALNKAFSLLQMTEPLKSLFGPYPPFPKPLNANNLCFLQHIQRALIKERKRSFYNQQQEIERFQEEAGKHIEILSALAHFFPPDISIYVGYLLFQHEELSLSSRNALFYAYSSFTSLSHVLVSEKLLLSWCIPPYEELQQSISLSKRLSSMRKIILRRINTSFAEYALLRSPSALIDLIFSFIRRIFTNPEHIYRTEPLFLNIKTLSELLSLITPLDRSISLSLVKKNLLLSVNTVNTIVPIPDPLTSNSIPSPSIPSPSTPSKRSPFTVSIPLAAAHSRNNLSLPSYLSSNMF